MRMDNKPSFKRLIGVIFVFFIYSVFGSVAYFFTLNLFAALIFIVIGSVVLILAWYQSYVKAPRYVDIEEDGATLYFVFRRPKFIKWEEITVFYYEPGNPSKRGEAGLGGGHFFLDNGYSSSILAKDVAQQMREQCRKKTGRYPPMKFNERKK
ncbi:MAG: hypothetical protein AB7E27_00675 [Candidatus Methanomethylophilaceae archaeon]|jgi:hypothetical protein